MKTVPRKSSGFGWDNGSSLSGNIVENNFPIFYRYVTVAMPGHSELAENPVNYRLAPKLNVFSIPAPGAHGGFP
jgi:hypothetical protein